jgi:hypothetical protein
LVAARLAFNIAIRSDLSLEQVADLNVERTSQSQEVQGGTVSNAPFDAAHVAPPDARRVCKRLLRHTLTLPYLPDAVPQTPKRWVLGGLPSLPGHGGMLPYCILSGHAR